MKIKKNNMKNDFADTIPYNKIINGNWKSLKFKQHPIVEKINYRFSSSYKWKIINI